MDGFLLVMVAFFRDLIRDIVDVNECVDDERYSDDQCPKSEVIEEHGHAFCPLGSRAGHLGRHTALDSPFGGHSETAAIPPDLDARYSKCIAGGIAAVQHGSAAMGSLPIALCEPKR